MPKICHYLQIHIHSLFCWCSCMRLLHSLFCWCSCMRLLHQLLPLSSPPPSNSVQSDSLYSGPDTIPWICLDEQNKTEVVSLLSLFCIYIIHQVNEISTPVKMFDRSMHIYVVTVCHSCWNPPSVTLTSQTTGPMVQHVNCTKIFSFSQIEGHIDCCEKWDTFLVSTCIYILWIHEIWHTFYNPEISADTIFLKIFY